MFYLHWNTLSIITGLVTVERLVRKWLVTDCHPLAYGSILLHSPAKFHLVDNLKGLFSPSKLIDQWLNLLVTSLFAALYPEVF